MKTKQSKWKSKLVKPTTFFTALFIVAIMILSSTITTGVISTNDQITSTIVQPHSTAQKSKVSPLISSARDITGTNAPIDSTPIGIPLLSEGFEGAWLPAGWSMVQTNPGPGSGSIPPYWSQTATDFHSGAKAAGLWWDYGHQDEWLKTPQVLLTGSTTGNYYVTFWTYGYEGSIYLDHYYLKISTNNGTSWTTLLDLSTLTGNAWNDWNYPYTIDLDAYAGQTVKLAWQAVDGDGAGLWYIWIIDDVEVGYFDVPDNDVGVTSIDAPVSGTATGSITPKVKVQNFGAIDQEDVPVDMSITRYGAPTSYFSDGFESYSPGYYNFPKGWTNTSINPTGDWYMYASTQTYSAVCYPRVQELLSNGAAQDETLISPIIDCSALTTQVNLSFTKYLNVASALDANLTIQGSDDGGATWAYTIATYIATSINAEKFTLAWAIGQNDVRIRFRFQSAADATLTSYFYFDNLFIGKSQPWGTYGNNAPAGWTIERKDTTAWNENHWYRYASTSYDQYGFSARIASLSPYVEVNDNLTSPSIDCSALTKVILELNEYFYSYTTYANKGYVEISVDAGAWQNIDTYEIVLPGVYGYGYCYEWYNAYDITTLAAGHSNIKIRFHFTRPALPGNAGYWYLDNVRIGDGSGTYKFIETFDGPTAYYTGFKNYVHDNWGGKWDWKVASKPHISNKWQNVMSGTSPTCTPHGGVRMAQAYTYIYQGMQAMLYSIPINVAAANTLKMSFWMYHDTIVGAGKIEVLASHDGLTWQTMATFNRNDGSANGWYQHLVSLAGYQDDTALQIAFKSTADYVAYINIDDLDVFDPGLITEYTDTAYVDVDVGQIVQVNFSTWTPVTWHNFENVDVSYDIVAATNLTADAVPANDGKLKAIQIHYPFFYDVKAQTIISPAANGDAKTLPVKVKIANIGQYAVRNFFTTVAIGSKLYNITGFYNNFDATDGGFTQNGGQWAWGAPNFATGPTAAHSGANLWGTVLGGNYVAGQATLDTVAITVPVGGDLSFWHWYDTEPSYDGGNVKISTNGGTTWTIIYPIGGYTGVANTANPLNGQAIWTGHTQKFWEYETFDLAAYEGQSVKFRFDFGADPSVFYPGWYVDDILVGTVTMTIVPEYDESAGQAAWFYPGQTVDLIYPDWTPDGLAAGISGVIEYGALATTMLSTDTNTANDGKLAEFALTYRHDVGVKTITQPNLGRAVTWLHYDTEVCTNALGLTAGGTWEGAIRLTPTELAAYDGFDVTKAKFMHGWPGGTSQPALNGKVKIYDAGTASTPGALLYQQAYTAPAGNAWFTIDLTTGVNIDASKDIWVSIEVTHAAGEYPLGMDASLATVGKGDFIYFNSAWSTLTANGFNNNWNIQAGVESGGGPGGVDIYLAPGVQPVQAIVNNLGTFVENGLNAHAEIWEYISNPNGTLAYTDDVPGINLNALGGEATAIFDTYNFADEGVYKLVISLPLGNDDVLTNNEKDLGIGIDDTAPVTTHTVTPATPDGTNGWYVSNVTIKLTATDAMSGVDVIKYQIDGGSWLTYTAQFKVSADGPHTVKYKATDKVGNEETEKTMTFKIDQTKPTIIFTKAVQFNKIIYTATVTDATSLVNRVEFFMNGIFQFNATAAPYTWTLTPIPGVTNLTVTAYVYDNAGLVAQAAQYGATSLESTQSSPSSQPHNVAPSAQKLVRG